MKHLTQYLIVNLFLYARARTRLLSHAFKGFVYSSALIVLLCTPNFVFSADSVSQLIRKLKSSDAFARQSAAARLGLSKDDRAVTPLIRALKDKKANVRRQAADSLGLLRNKMAIPHLAKLLTKDSSTDVRQAAVLALSSMPSRDSVPALISGLRDKDATIVLGCVRSLGQIKAKEASSALSALLPKAKGDLKFEIVTALGKMGGTESFDQIKKSLASSDYTLRYAAIKALGRLNRADVIPSLQKISKELNPGYRAGAMWSLSKLGGTFNRNDCAALLFHPDPTIRRDVVEAMQGGFNKDLRNALKDAMTLEKDQAVKQMMTRILESNRL